MDPNLIYAKTRLGEEAMHQRTRVIQRNIRMVLILVDGQSTVADLCLKTGNTQLTENALSELERGGFILPKIEQDSLWEESKRVAREIRAAVAHKTSFGDAAAPASRQDRHEKYPDFAGKPAAPPVSEPPASPSEIPISLHSVFNTPAFADFAASQFSIAPEMGEAGEGEPGVRPAQQQAKPERQVPPGPSLMERLKAMLARADHELDEEPVSIKPIRRARRRSLGWPVIVVVLVLALAGSLLAASVLFPFASYLPDAEAAMARALGRPVTIGAMHVAFQPSPALVLERVDIGSGQAAIRIGEIRLRPDPASLLAAKIGFAAVAVGDTEFSAGQMPALRQILSALSDSAAKLGVRRVSFERVALLHGALALRDLSGETVPGEDGLLQSLRFASADRSLSLEAKPTARGAELVVEGFAWRPLEGLRLVFDSLALKGRLEDGNLSIESMDLRLLGGQLSGRLAVGDGRRPALSGEISGERINAAALVALFGLGERISGDLGGELRFAAESEAWSALGSRLVGDGVFVVRRGRLIGIDLPEAMRRVSTAPVEGGVTSFEDLSGSLSVRPGQGVRFSSLAMRSGMLRSSGQIEVAADGKLNGRMELQLQGSVNQTRVPVVVGGTLAVPSVARGG